MHISIKKLRQIIKEELDIMSGMSSDAGHSDIAGGQIGGTTWSSVPGIIEREMGATHLDDVRRVMSLFDPTGALSWPDFIDAQREYERNPTTTNQLVYILATIAVVPVVGGVGRLATRLGAARMARLITILDDWITGVGLQFPARLVNIVRNIMRVGRAGSRTETTGQTISS